MITEYEMDRRKAIIHARSDLTDQMVKHDLTALEWIEVLAEMQKRMISIGLRDEWKPEGEP